MHLNPLLPFLMAGDPALDRLPGYLEEAHRLGLSTVEVGLPHSDPIADGPVLQAAAHRAIAKGATPLRVLEALAGLQACPELVLFTYLNPLLQLGLPRLVEVLRATPVRALLVVDLPFGEEPAWESALRSEGYPVVPLLAPTTGLDRARQLLAERPDPGPAAPFAQRFAYVVARLGVTGAGSGTDLAPVADRVSTLRQAGAIARPLAVGFGLSDRASLAAVRRLGATPVVGTALVAELARGMSLTEALMPRLVEDDKLVN